ncbi:hypothetical protein [Paraburkholderia tropica]|uniref:hypothetical protein n=1 Tax=Paraburkholderia tropica TaxID=92647 RepID=UPI001590AA38|nr:hypothetical protein [Paraburkholderia tropica]
MQRFLFSVRFAEAIAMNMTKAERAKAVHARVNECRTLYAHGDLMRNASPFMLDVTGSAYSL